MSDLPPPASPPPAQAYEPPTPPQLPPPLPYAAPAPVAPDVVAEAARAAAARVVPPAPAFAAPPLNPTSLGEAQVGTFTTRKAGSSVTLEVDGERYSCATSCPSDPLLAALHAQQSRNNMELLPILRNLIAVVMDAESRARYEARLAGVDPERPQLAPIDPVDMIAHGLWLVEVYLARPTEPPVSSGATPSGPPAGI